MVGGDNYNATPVQPRDPGPAPARLRVQAVRARRGAQAGHLPRLHLGVGEADLHPQGRRALHGEQLQRRVRRRDHAAGGHDVLRQRGLRAGRHAGRPREGRQARPPDGHPHAGLPQPRDRARRPAPGRDAAGHGARVRDVRDGGRLTYGTLSPGQAARPSRCPGPSGIERSTRAAARTPPVEVDGQKLVNHCAQDRAQAARSPTRSARSCRPSSARHRHGGADPRRGHRRQDRHDREYGDAWFVGWTKAYTVAVWVGYRDEFQPMETEFPGSPSPAAPTRRASGGRSCSRC